MKITAKKIARLKGHKASVFALGVDDTTGELISGAGDGWVVRWQLDNPDLGRLIAKVETQIFSLAYLADLSVAVVGNMNGGVHWIDLKQPEQTRNVAHHQKGVFGIVRIENAIFSIGGGGTLTRWSLQPFRTQESFQISNQSLRSIDYQSERNELAVGASDNSIYLLDASNLQIKKKLSQAHDNSVFALRYSPNGRFLLSGGRDAHLKVWDLEANCKLVSSQAAHWFTLNDIAFSPQGRWFATASRDKTIKIWDAESFQLLKVLESGRDQGHLNSVNRLFWGERLVSASDDRTMIVWQVEE